MIVTRQELEQITGRKWPRHQVAWITEHYPDCPAFVNAQNEAVIIRAHLERATTILEQPKSRIRIVRGLKT